MGLWFRRRFRTGNLARQMELPASTFHPEIRRSLESLSPLDSYIWCGTPRRERIGTSSRLHLPVWKLPRGISAYANSPHCISEVVDFEPRGFGKKGRIHFVGVGGSGLSALAMLALKQVIWILYFCNFTCVRYIVCFIWGETYVLNNWLLIRATWLVVRI